MDFVFITFNVQPTKTFWMIFNKVKKQFINVIAALLVIFITGSFTAIKSNNLTGIYGVSDNDPSQIQLVINDDHSFTYRDYSNPAKRIDVKGKWREKGNSVILIGENESYSFHKKWKISGSVAKSRKGLTFYRLCRVQ